MRKESFRIKPKKPCPVTEPNLRNGKCYGDYEYTSPCDPELYNSPQSGRIIYNCKSPMKCVGAGFCGYSSNDYNSTTNSWIPEDQAQAQAQANR